MPLLFCGSDGGRTPADSGLRDHKKRSSLQAFTEEIENASVRILDSPPRSGKTLRTYDFIPPKFHLTPPKYYSSLRRKIFIFTELLGISSGEVRLFGDAKDID